MPTTPLPVGYFAPYVCKSVLHLTASTESHGGAYSTCTTLFAKPTCADAQSMDHCIIGAPACSGAASRQPCPAAIRLAGGASLGLGTSCGRRTSMHTCCGNAGSSLARRAASAASSTSQPGAGPSGCGEPPPASRGEPRGVLAAAEGPMGCGLGLRSEGGVAVTSAGSPPGDGGGGGAARAGAGTGTVPSVLERTPPSSNAIHALCMGFCGCGGDGAHWLPALAIPDDSGENILPAAKGLLDAPELGAGGCRCWAAWSKGADAVSCMAASM